MFSTARTKKLDMPRFNEVFMMHTSTSPQYGIIASSDVAAAMMEQPAGRALVQETIEEALSFRRAMTAVGQQLKGSWWFEVWQPDAIAKKPADQGRLGAEAGREMARVQEPCREPRPGRPDQGHHPHARALRGRTDAEARHTGGGGDKFLSSRRIEIEKTGLYSFLVLFSMGITKGKWSTLVTELVNFKDLYDANAPLKRVLPALVEAHPETYAKMGLKDLCTGSTRLSRIQHAEGPAGHVHDAARDGAAARGCLRTPRARARGERRDRQSDGPHRWR